jgi:hypothetical protein
LALGGGVVFQHAVELVTIDEILVFHGFYFLWINLFLVLLVALDYLDYLVFLDYLAGEGSLAV